MTRAPAKEQALMTNQIVPNSATNNNLPPDPKIIQDLTRDYPKLAPIVRDFFDREFNPLAADDSLPNKKTRWTIEELVEANFPAPNWAVDTVIPVGLTFLAGRPKLGKSWLALQIAHAVGTGGKVLGIQVNKGKVLYLALEDSARRLKDRTEKQRIPADATIQFVTEWQSLKEGGLTELQIEIMRGGYSLVIIDTLSRAIGRSDQLDPAEMTIVIGSLQQLAISLNIAILVIDHHRKSNGFESSPIDDILGSTAKAAVADGALGLYKQQGKQGATLKITGRDMEEKELALAWDGLTCCWQSLGSADDVRTDSVKGDILRVIRELKEDNELPTPARIAKSLKLDRGFVSHTLADLWTAGKVRKAEKVGREQPYELPL